MTDPTELRAAIERVRAEVFAVPAGQRCEMDQDVLAVCSAASEAESLRVQVEQLREANIQLAKRAGYKSNV